MTDLQVSFPQKDMAVATFTGTLDAMGTEGDTFREIHELVCTLQKLDKDWLLAETEVVDVLQK